MRKPYLLLLPALLLAGCNDTSSVIDSLVDDIGQSGAIAHLTIPDTVTVITSDIARMVAGSYAGVTDSRSTTAVIESVETVCDEQGKPLYYVTNYANDGGFVIVSATKDYYPVLAHSDKGHYDIAAANEGPVSIVMAPHEALISEPELIPDSVVIEAHRQWADYLETQIELPEPSRSETDVYNLMRDYINQFQREGCQVYRLSDFIWSSKYDALPYDVQQQILETARKYAYMYLTDASGDYDRNLATLVVYRSSSYTNASYMLSTAWDQISCAKYDPHGKYYVPGCASIAAGQIMYYHKHPASINWGDMPLTGANSTLGAFVFEFAEKSGASYGTAGLGGTAIYPSNTTKTLRNYGYKKANLINHDINTVQSNLYENRPVYMQGEKSNGEVHAWVCDGYEIRRSTSTLEVWCVDDVFSPSIIPEQMLKWYDYDVMESIYYYYHMNWGDGNYSKYGYYYDSNLSTDNSFIYNRLDIVDIYPSN